MELNDDISLIINSFPFPPSSYPKVYTHEKCIDNPIHDPYLFENTISNYFSSKSLNELNERDMIRKEIALGKSQIPMTPYTPFTPYTPYSAYSSCTPIYEIKSFNRENLILSKIPFDNKIISYSSETSNSNSIDITNNIPEPINNSKSNSVVNKLSIPNNKNYVRSNSVVNRISFSNKNINNSNETSNVIYPLKKLNLISKSNPNLMDNNKSRRLSFNKIKFGKSKSMNNIKSHSFYEKNEQETSIIRELSNDFKKILTNYGILKEEINFVSKSNHESMNSINLNNVLKKEYSDISESRVKFELNKNTENKYEKSNRSSLSKISSEYNRLSQHNINENQNINNIQNIESKLEATSSNNNDNDNNNNIQYKTNIENKNNSLQIQINKENADKIKDDSNVSLSKLEQCQTNQCIETSRKSILMNKSKSITLLAPIASISLASNGSPVDELETPKELKEGFLNKENNKEYNKEYIKQISVNRLKRYKSNGGFVRDRIQKFKSNDELLSKPITLSSSLNNNASSSNSLINTRKKSLGLIDNNNNYRVPTSPTRSSAFEISSKLKNGDSNYDLPIFEKFKSNDDIIKEKITVLNMTAHFKNEPVRSSSSRILLEDSNNNYNNDKENNLIENIEILRQGIFGTLPSDKKEKLIEFLISLDVDNINKYQQQLHEECNY